MPDGLDIPSWMLWVVALSVLAAAVRGIGGFVHWSRLDRGVAWLMKAIFGPFVASAIQQLDERIIAIQNELQPNSGKTVRDSLDRVERLVEEIAMQGERIDSRLTEHLQDHERHIYPKDEG